MQLSWYGHSCFLIKTTNGKRILIDPFCGDIGYRNEFPKCDLITISHNHFDHNYLNDINSNTKIIKESGLFHMDFVLIDGIKTFHDKCNGIKRGPNIIYIYKFNECTICHLGDLGHIPSDLIIDKLGGVDILLVPIGGHFTLDGFEAARLCNLISPHYIIPMHYKTNKTALYLDDAKKFITSIKNIKVIKSNALDISLLNFNNKCEVLLLNLSL